MSNRVTDQELEAIEAKQDAHASYPGRVRVNMFRYMVFYPRWPIGIGIVLLITGLATFLLHKYFVVLFALTFLFAVIGWRQIKGRYISGCLNPAKIISFSPPLLAVASDFTHSPKQSWPAIKILRQPIESVLGPNAQVGDRVPTVAYYTNGPDNSAEHWGDITPDLVAAGTSDPSEIQRTLGEITEERWSMLDQGLAQIPQPYTENLHRIYVESHFTDERLPPAAAVERFMEERPNDDVFVGCAGLDAKRREEMADWCSATELEQCLAIILRGTKPEGAVMLPTELLINHGEHRNRRLPYDTIRGAFFGWGRFELALKSGERIILRSTFTQFDASFERCINAICGVIAPPIRSYSFAAV